MALDPPFANTTLRYEMHYALSNVLSKNGERYELDHDFAFPGRDGPISNSSRCGSRSILPGGRCPRLSRFMQRGRWPPAGGYVLTIPMRFTGSERPAAIDISRPAAAVQAVALVVGVTLLAIGWFFVRERSFGRFAPLEPSIDETWLRDHVFKYPAEVVAAAWDESIGNARRRHADRASGRGRQARRASWARASRRR
jgi:hypothetical protein